MAATMTKEYDILTFLYAATEYRAHWPFREKNKMYPISGQKLHSAKAGLEQSMSQGKQKSAINYAMIIHSASAFMPH